MYEKYMHKTTSTDITNISRDDQIHTAMQEPPHIPSYTNTYSHKHTHKDIKPATLASNKIKSESQSS